MKSKYNNYFLLNFIIALMFIIISLFIYIIDISFESKFLFFAWIGNFILLWGLWAFKRMKSTHINPYTFFFISYFFFSYGQVFLYSVGLIYTRFNLIELFLNEEIIDYCLYFCLGTCFLLFGALIAIKKDVIVEKKIDSLKLMNELSLIKAMKIVAWVMLIISAPIYLKDFITNLTNSINHGYRSIYVATDSSSVLNIIESFSMWFIPSLFMLLVLYKKNRYFRWFILIILSLITIGIFIIGSRSNAVAIIISLLYLWNVEIRKFKKKDKMLLILGLTTMFLTLPIIQSFRGLDNKSILGFKEIYYSMKSDNNLFVDIVGELGSSMHPWLLVNRLIPKIHSFRLGQSYIASVFAIIPSVLMGGFSLTKYSRLSGWLQKAANMSYGPGFSILAEAYYNFGWFGIPILFIIGYIFFKFLSNNMLKGNIIKFKKLFSAIALFALITSARSSLYLTIRFEIYVILVPIIFIKLIHFNLQTRKINKESL